MLGPVIHKFIQQDSKHNLSPPLFSIPCGNFLAFFLNRYVSNAIISYNASPSCLPEIDMVDDVLEMVSCITFYSRAISPFMWSLLPRYAGKYNLFFYGCNVFYFACRLVSIFHDWGYDFLQAMISIFDNYISQGTAVLINSQANPPQQNFMSMLMSIPSFH